MDVSALLGRLGLRPDATERDVRRAYARELKQIDQETQSEQFQELRQTYEYLMLWLSQQQAAQRQTETEPAPQEQPQPPEPLGQPAQQELLTQAQAVQGNPRPDPEGEPQANTERPQPQQGQEARADQATPASPEELARGMLELVTQRLADSSFPDRAAWSRFLARCLEDQSLEQLDAQRYFEWGIANILANGWRPGHELLLAPAIECFSWGQDRSRLLRLGRAGHVIDAAIAEISAFDSQPDANRQAQRDVIRALRGGGTPSATRLAKALPIADFVVAAFPNWMHVVSQPRNLLEWRRLHAQAPAFQRDTDSSAPASKKEAAKASSSSGSYVLLYLILVALGALSRMGIGSPPPIAAPKPAAFNSAAASSQDYAARIVSRVKDNIVYASSVFGNPAAEIEVLTTPNGTIIERKLITSSGVPSWDEAVLRAVDKTGSLPPDADGRVPPTVILSLRPKSR